jgi:hypothetical protein
MHREHYCRFKGAIPLEVSCSYIVLLIEPCFSMEHGSINSVHQQTAGSSKLVHQKSGSSKSVQHQKSGSLKLVHQKSASLNSDHWKLYSGDVHLPKIKFVSGQARQADVAPAVLKWLCLIVLYLYKSDYLHKNALSCVCAAKTYT